MNTPPLTPDQEREWTLQERALAQERGAEGADAPPAYRLLARALREPLDSAPPAGFAALLARRVECAALPDLRWERRATAALVALLLLLAAAGLAWQGQDWLRQLLDAMPSLPRLFNGWGLLLLAGLAVAYWPAWPDERLPGTDRPRA
ncbi:hypothetical protein [Tahibacter caeni]|uniref:hypothetical protein n=1 Tax=Tahibacter caeni TaxID=1453545 RepID=UPI0021487645|nr:hypothetical protein [Tahibacter caeni]